MQIYSFCLLVAIIVFAIPTNVGAQVKRSKPADAHGSPKEKENSRIAEARQQEAVSLLTSLATEAKTFNARLRSHVQAQAAHFLWNIDNLLARDLFSKAWDAAEIADQEIDKDDQSPPNSNAPTVSSREARLQVIALAAQSDTTLCERFLAKLNKTDEGSTPDVETKNRNLGNSLSTEELDRLTAARFLVENGHLNQARELAGNALNRVVIPTIMFLVQFRENNSSAADQLYLSLLSRAAADTGSDANTVSLLSSYVVSPYLYVRISNSGFPVVVQTTAPHTPVDVTPSVRSAFLVSAAQILLRPTPAPPANRICYMVATRLLPLFDGFDPNLAAQIRWKLLQLSPSIPPNFKTNEALTRISRSVSSTDNQSFEELLDKANQLPNSAMRDGVYIRAAILAAEQGNSKAEEIVEGIRNEELRNQVRVYVFMTLARYALKNKSTEKALKFARSEELPAIGRVWIYLQVADLIGKKQRAQAIEITLQALAVARGIDNADPDRARSLVGIIAELLDLNPELATEFFSEFITTANQSNKFNGDEATLNITVDTPFGDWSSSYGTPNFTLKKLFLGLAKADFFQAATLANNLRRPQLRSLAVVSVAEAVLREGDTRTRSTR